MDNEHPLIQRALFLLNHRIVSPWELYQFWSVAGPWHRQCCPPEEITPHPWYEGLIPFLRHPDA